MSDREFLKIFSGLMGSLAVLAVVLFVLANILGGKVVPEGADMVAVAERIKPVGEVTIGSGVDLIATANAAGADKGKSVFDGTCNACHGAGVAGAPKAGDKAAWAPRIAQGTAKLYEHALKGFQGKSGFMPSKGGNAGLADADVKAAVDYMVSKAK
ncbi:MAG: cytochrome c5 family protein [Gammaproteobacteria bacterium]|nr:cytochrome c5 family protein [Gammaproteobacteria bacterium]